MADNTQLNANSSAGDIIATDDIAGTKHQRVKVEYGDDGFATDVSHSNPLPVTMQSTVIPGSDPTIVPVWRMGEREQTSIVVTGEDLWRGNELTPNVNDDEIIPVPPDAGERMTVVSESNNDRQAGGGQQGVWEVKIQYIDAAGAEQEETITMNGTNGVNTTANDIRFINNIYATDVGSSGSASGHIKIHQFGDNREVYNMIYAGTTTSTVPNYMVPLGKTLVLAGWHIAAADSRRAFIKVSSTDVNGVINPRIFSFKDTTVNDRTCSGTLHLNTPIPALSIVKLIAFSGEANCRLAGGWHGDLIDNS